MGAPPGVLAPRSALAVNLDLSHGRHGAAARVEFDDAPDGTVARLLVCGWIDRVALSRLVAIVEDLARRGIVRLALDGSQIRHIDFRLVRNLVACLARLESTSFDYGVCGLSPALRDRFRLAGSPPGRHEFASADALIATRDRESKREWAS